MSIIIQNITQEHVTVGHNLYLLRINDRKICNFTHDRSYNGLAECLRDAADAVDAQSERCEEQMTMDEMFEVLEGIEDKLRTGG